MKKEILKSTDKEFKEHLDEMQLTLFFENRLNEAEKEEVFKHLSQCKRCREVLKVATEIKQEEEKLKPVNNINYKKFSRLAIASVAAVAFFAQPNLAGYPDEVNFKGGFEEKSFLDKTLYYWECRFEDVFGDLNKN